MWTSVAAYFAVRPWERRLFGQLAVDWFARFVPFGYWMNRGLSFVLRRPFRIVRAPRSARICMVFTIVVEVAHLLAFGFLLVRVVLQAQVGDWAGAAEDGLVNAAINGYPCFVQRYNRDRLLRIFHLQLERLPSWRM